MAKHKSIDLTNTPKVQQQSLPPLTDEEIKELMTPSEKRTGPSPETFAALARYAKQGRLGEDEQEEI